MDYREHTSSADRQPRNSAALATGWVALLIGLWLSPAIAAVGRLPGTFAVGSAGDATYTIPLHVAPGRNGLTPNLALTYSSQAGNGLAGIGWDIAGLSTISRCPKTIATNGIQQGVQFTTSDQFCLDGQPLVKDAATSNTGAYGADGVVYRTEIDTYARVTSHGTTNGGPTYFEVQRPNGLTYFYGNTSDARIAVAVGASTYTKAWAVNQIQDKFYNSIRFEYYDSASDFKPKEVRWTDHCSSYGCAESSGSGARYKLVLNYELRPAADQRSGYLAGSAWSVTKRLSRIDYKLDDAVVQDYQLAYTTPTSDGTQRSQLQAITLCGASHSDCFAATSMEWQNGVVGFGSETSHQSSDDASRAMFGDFNGDGRTDILNFSANSQWEILQATGAGFTAVNLGVMGFGAAPSVADFDGDGRADVLGRTSVSPTTWHIYSSTGGGFETHATGISGSSIGGMASPASADVNGDGLPDLIYKRDGVGYIRLNDGAYFSTSTEVEAIGLVDGETDPAFVPASGAFRPVDFDGDGRQDLLVQAQYGGVTTWCPYKASPSTGMWGSVGGCLGGGVLVAHGADINGDGLSDLIYYKSTVGWYSRLSNGDSFQSPQLMAVSSNDLAEQRAMVLDYDQDGRADLVRVNDGSVISGTFVAHLSDGAGYANTAARMVSVSFPAWQGISQMTAIDTTGDGLDDVVYFGSYFSWKQRVRAGLQPDRLSKITDGLGNTFKNLNYKPLSDSSVYTASSSSAMPTPAPASPYNRRLLGGTMQVLSQYTTNDGVGGEYNLNYTYWNGYANSQGRGFLGFSRVRSKDSRDRAPDMVTDFRLDFPYNGLTKSRVICQHAKNCVPTTAADRLNLFSAQWASANYRYDSNSPYYFQVHATDEDTTEYDVNGTSVLRITERDISSWSDALGAPLTDKTTVKASASEAGWETTTTFAYDDSTLSAAGTWCLGLPTATTVTRKKPDATTETRNLQVSYYSNCKPHIRRIGPTAGTNADLKRLMSTFEYDEYGNVDDVVEKADSALSTDPVSGNALVQQHTSFSYAADAGYHVSSIAREVEPGYTDGCGSQIPAVTLSTMYTWDWRFGLQKTETQPEGQVTTRTYDAFSRLSRDEATTLGVATDYTYSSCGTCFASRSAYKVSAARSDGLNSATFFDSFERQVGQSSVLIDGRESRQAVTYNILGQVVFQDVPHVRAVGPGALPADHRINISYDDLGRQTLVTRWVDQYWPTAEGATYSGLTKTVTNDGELARQKVLVYNADGTLKTVTEKNPQATDSVTSYEYTPFGQLSKITDAGTSAGIRHDRTFGYDGRGFQISSSDADRGAWTFDYDAFGNLERESRPNGTTTTTYDPIGRPVTRVDKTAAGVAEQNTSWSYVQSGNGRGLLSEMAVASYFKHTFTYNSKGLVSQDYVNLTQGSSTNAWYQTDYSYDTYGRLDTVTYPAAGSAGRAAFQYSYTNGSLSAVCQLFGSTCGSSVYTVDATAAQPTDALGRVTAAYFGSASTGPYETYSYDPASLGLTALKTTQSGSSGLLQHYWYAWDEYGNLATRTNAIPVPNVVEGFHYDALNRLDYVTRSAGGAATTTMDLSYDPDGNIKTKAGVDNNIGTYNYATSGTGAGPHAVSNITGGTVGAAGTFHYDSAGNLDCRMGWNGTGCSANSGTTWFSFNLPQRINYSGNGGSYADFSYGPSRELVRQTVVTTTPATNKTTYYIGPHFEVEVENDVAVRYRSNVFFGERLVYSQIDKVSVPADLQQYYIHQDYQGSVDRVSLAGGSSFGGSTQFSFDAFGKRRETSWLNDADNSTFGDNHWLERGYTGHEMLDNVRMIHMRGRVQDPVWGRMLSPDPMLGDLTLPQSLNPYSYVSNNPVMFIDPTGFIEEIEVSGTRLYWDVSVDRPVHAGLFMDDQLARLLEGIKELEDYWKKWAKEKKKAKTNGPSEPQGQKDSDDPICNNPGLGGGSKTLSQRADLARFQAVGGVVGGALFGRLPGAVLGYGAAIGYNAYGLRAGGVLVQGGSQQGNLAYGAAAQGLGIPLTLAQRFAGFYEQYGPKSGGEYRPENGTFYGDPPYGDDPSAQQAIAEGYACGQ